MTIPELFDSLDYGPTPESPAEALAWIESRGGIVGPFISDSWGPLRTDHDLRNPATGAHLAHMTQCTVEEVAAAVAAARKAQSKWAALTGHHRARIIYAIARLMQKHARLLAVMESLDTGKPIRESRDIDIPLAIRHFYYHAGMAQLMETELPDRAPLGVCGQIIPWNFPLLMLAWKIAPAIATGNTVVLKPAEYTPLSAMIFAEICQEAGLPPGVVNIVTGDGATGAALVAADVDKIAFTGSTEVGRQIRRATAGTGKALTLELGGKSPYIVFDDADQDSAVEGLVDAIWFNQGQVCCAGSRLLVQESIAEGFYTKLRARMETLRVGDPLDKCTDIGALIDPSQHAAITAMVEANTEGETFRSTAPDGCYYPPTLITGLSPANPLMQDEIFGPVLVASTFRTPSEAVQMANNTRYGLAASVWSENINLALDIAPKLAAGIIWINGTNMMDAAAGFGGIRDSGFEREGGWEGLRAYTKPANPPKSTAVPKRPRATDQIAPEGLDRTAKMYIDGKQARPDSGYSRVVHGAKGKLLGHVGDGNRKDIRNAVEAAAKATSWAKTTGHLRAQILYYIAENLAARADEFTVRLTTAGIPVKAATLEVETSISRLFTYAAWSDKLDGTTKDVPIRGFVLAINEPVGVIGAICPPEMPLLGTISAMAPAIAMGNRVVLVPSDIFPLAATDLYQVLDTSDVPAGVVNIITGDPAALADTLSKHMEVDAIWSFAEPALAKDIETNAATNLKRTWITRRDWIKSGEGRDFLNAATEVKTIWVPYGE
ncbi:aldehyde dehydrogenase family protein [Actibacterium sp. 188UL27-1]|uniref:aldehyde dehydrogenase family protein n=1 Tax=Actibacterium sp. 188UL27-1 TaxID=2786961 RepID=UPI001959548E|nr:aldehyde dehydrogenase family protein [Actibacterium sp. 188UL27-1]MBM7066397.1 aldehyde dehydrogenase family protein [Actibacterium sp. 188UL27-1]